MKEILEVILAGLVENIDSITILEKETGNLTEIEVKIPEEDMGRVIGKQGKTANAIRTLMKSLAGRERKKISIEFECK